MKLLRPILFQRFPTWRWQPRENEQIIPPAEQAAFPDLAQDLQTLEEQLMPQFRELDNKALRSQNAFRWEQVILIGGGILVTTMGAVNATFKELSWPGVVQAMLASALAAVALYARSLKAQDRYFTNRLKAEALRGEYFLFLGRIGLYADEAERVRHLKRRMAEIRGREEAS
jgi:Protein of unknown function (DUF4231)